MSLRGSQSARIDDRSRLKVPADFRRVIEQTWGQELFVTSFNGRDVNIYPLPVWEEFEKKLLRLPVMDPKRMRIQKVVNYHGKSQTMDSQGRILIHSPLREKAGIGDEVMVLGFGDHLCVQEASKLEGEVAASIESDMETLSELLRNE